MKGLNIKSFLINSLLICCASLGTVFGQELISKKQNAPVISDVMPREIAQGMFIKVIGYRLGGIEKNQLIFSQNEKNFIGKSIGGSTDGENFTLIVKVPEGLAPGTCQVSVELEGQHSSPFTIEVATSAKPPKLLSITPAFVNPGDTVSVRGIGFNEKDTFELIDSEGKKYSQNIENMSTDASIGFQVPEKAYSGLMTLKVIENRSGQNQSSNALTFEVLRGAVPLTITGDNSISLAPGQWLEPQLWHNQPLINATKIEFLLKQGDKEQKSSVTNFKKIRFQIPESFAAGKFELKTRTWIKDEASPWSQPINFNVSATPRKPVIFSFQIVPEKAQALFMQDEKSIVSPVYLGVLPSSRIPEKINDGSLQIFTRFQDNGKFTGWKLVSKYDSFSKTNRNFLHHPEYDKRPQINFNSFYNRVNVRNNQSEFFEIKPGQNLRIYGDFYVESVDKMKVTLENSNRKISLKPKKQEFDGMLLVKIPGDAKSGDWQLTITNQSEKVETVAATKLRIK